MTQPTQEKVVLIRYLRALERAKADIEHLPYHMKDTELHQVMLLTTSQLDELIFLVGREINDLDEHRRPSLESQLGLWD